MSAAVSIHGVLSMTS